MSYLVTNDLLQVACVSREWYRFIGTSTHCMKKIKLKLHDEAYISREDVMIFINSRRKYTNLSIRNREITPKIRFIVGSFHWKTVEIRDVRFVWDINFLDFVGIFEPSAVNMTFHNVGIMAERAAFDTNYVFPKLRKLSITKSSRVIVRRVFTGCTTLDKFILEVCQHGDPESAAVVGNIQNLLIRCNNLKTLHLGLATPIFNMTFTDDFVANINFELRSLGIKKFQRTHQFQNMIAFVNLGVFLLKHAETLRSISISEWMGQHIINIVFSEMNVLESVTIKNIHMYSVKEDLEYMVLTQSTTITSLDIYSYISIEKCFEWILKAVPNLRKLKMYCMSPKTVSFLKQHNHKLENIQLDCIVAGKTLSALNASNSSGVVDNQGEWNFIITFDGGRFYVKN